MNAIIKVDLNNIWLNKMVKALDAGNALSTILVALVGELDEKGLRDISLGDPSGKIVLSLKIQD